MPIRNHLAAIAIAVITVNPTVAAADFSEAAIFAIDRMESQGFVIDSVSRTFLGRIKIISHNTDYSRETVFHAVTMEILQDRLIPIDRSTNRSGGGSSSATPVAPLQGSGTASTAASSTNGRSQSQTSGTATGRSATSNSSSTTNTTRSNSRTVNNNGSVTTTTTDSTTSSAGSSASTN